MTTSRIFAPLAAAMLIAAGAAPAAAKPGQGSSSAADQGERKICKTFHMTGSRVRAEKLCLTKSEWKKFDENR